MNQKQILILVAIIFSIVGVGIFINYKRASNFHDEILKADINQIQNVKLYKDFLRDDEGLDLPINDKTDLEQLLVALKNMKSSSRSLKSLEVEKLYKVRLNLVVEDNRLLTISIYRTKETGDLGIINIAQGDAITVPVGDYESAELLKWVEKMQQKEGFEKNARSILKNPKI